MAPLTSVLWLIRWVAGALVKGRYEPCHLPLVLRVIAVRHPTGTACRSSSATAAEVAASCCRCCFLLPLLLLPPHLAAAAAAVGALAVACCC